MGDAVDAVATGTFVAGIVYVTVRAVGDREGAFRAAALAFLAAAPVNYLGRRVIARRGGAPGAASK